MDKKRLEAIKKIINELKTTKIVKQEVSSSFITVESYNCTLNNGHVIRREKILKGNKDGSAAIVLAITEEEKIILAIEPRVFTQATVDIGLPSGYIEDDETPEEAAKRELLEETGYNAGKMLLLGSYYQDQGCSSAYNYYFLAKNCFKVNKQKLDESEYIKYILVDYNELMWLLDNNYIKGLNSAYAIETAKKYIKK